MDNDEQLTQFTVRLPQKIKDKIDNLAKSNGCSAAELIRLSIDGGLNKYLDEVQYIDKEQGEAIKGMFGKVFTEMANIKTELNRIGVNYNQEVKLKNLERKFSQRQIDMKELIREQDFIRKECKNFSPEAINELMDRYEQISEGVISDIMAYTRISHTKNGKAGIRYARGSGTGHNGHSKRNILIGGVGMLPDEMLPFEEQMEQEWARASDKNKNQIRRIVASFSKKELDPLDMDCAYTALEISQEFVEAAYPNRKAAIFVQNDGKGENLHVHILVSNVDSIEHKGCTDEQTKFEYVKNNFNKTAGRFITLDNGKKAKEKLSQNERRMQEENEKAADNGGAMKYIWKDDLRERIRIAMKNANSENDFLEALEDEGVTARYGTSKQYGDYISYELLDVPDHIADMDRKYKARSYTLGDAYGVEALREKLREKAGELLQTTEQHNNTVKSKDDLPDNPQESEFHTETAAQAPVKRAPEITSKDFHILRGMKGTINALNSAARRDDRTEKPAAPAQPINSAPPTAAEQTSSTTEKKQYIQSETTPKMGELSAYAKMQRIRKQMDDEEMQRQHDNMDWFPRR